jgi:hypothetical protein
LDSESDIALVIAHTAEEAFLDLLTAVGYTLRLYRVDVTTGLTEAQLEALTAASFTEANFAGYAAKTLTGGSWVTTQADPSTATYAQQTFTRTSTGTVQNIYGYYVTRTSDGVLMWYEKFAGVLSVTANGDAIVITPTLTLDDDSEGTMTARGVVAQQVLTSNSASYSADATTDFALANVDVDSTRTYRINFNSIWGIGSPPGRWILELWIDGTLSARVGDVESAGDGGAGYVDAGTIDFSQLWMPTTGSRDLELRINEISGSSSFSFPGDATFPRMLWVEDVGARLP